MSDISINTYKFSQLNIFHIHGTNTRQLMKPAKGIDDKQAPYMNFAEHQKKHTPYYGLAIP